MVKVVICAAVKVIFLELLNLILEIRFGVCSFVVVNVLSFRFADSLVLIISSSVALLIVNGFNVF